MEESRNAQRAGNLKVALLSTGLAVNSAQGQWFDELQAWPSSKNFIDGDNTDDSDGMGTDLARLLVKTCPDIDLFMAKVACDRVRHGLSAHVVAKVSQLIFRWQIVLTNKSAGYLVVCCRIRR